MMFDNNLNTMDFQRKDKVIDPTPQLSQPKRTSANTTTDNEKRRSGSPVEDTNNMFTKFAFPFKLHSILESAGTSGKESIISWLPSGKAFKIHKPKEFADVIMPQYFNQTKYRSFQRQLYIYGFDRVKDKSSDDYGAYFHELFIRGASDLCLDMQRQKIKGTGLSNDERRKKASIGRGNSSKSSSNKRSMKCQNDMVQQPLTTSMQTLMFPDNQTSVATESLFSAAIRMNASPDTQTSNATESLFSAAIRMNASLSNKMKMSLPVSVKGTPTADWNRQSAEDVIESAIQAQEYATRQDSLALTKNNNTKHGFNARLPSLDKMMMIGRRCSLGFVRGMGRRGSLLYDGDEVLFGNKKFFFTNEY